MPTSGTTRIEVHFTPLHLDEMQLKDRNVVVIDVLRASSSVAMALFNGAKEIIPVNTIDSAVKISGNLFGDVTLRAGERNGRMIEGFNLGNSPGEYAREIVGGKSIIFLSTNGSAAMVKGRHAKNLIVAGFVNISAVVEHLKELGGDITIVCAGQDNLFCLEDAVCAGKLVNMVDADSTLNDAGRAAVAIEKQFGKSVLRMLRTSSHGRYLTDIGFGGDLKICAAVDSVPVVPVMSGNVIRSHKEAMKRSA